MAVAYLNDSKVIGLKQESIAFWIQARSPTSYMTFRISACLLAFPFYQAHYST